MNYKELEKYHENKLKETEDKVFVLRWISIGICVLLVILCVAAYVYAKKAG